MASNPNPSHHDSTQNHPLPHDIIIDILTKLTVKSLIRFKGVCKLWYSLIKDDKFIKQHYDTHNNCQKYFMTSIRHKKDQLDFYHYTMDVPQLDSSSTASLVESPVPINQLRVALPHTQYFSSNGILLIIYDDDIIVMWNPATRESRRIPSPILSKCGLLYSFCYFPRIDEYKIFRVGTRLVNGNMNDMEIDIFSTKSNIWKSIGPIPPKYYYYGSSVVMTDGIVYMTARRTENLISCTILRFCLEKEQFHDELLFPYTIEGKRHVVYCVGEKLCLSRTLGDHNHQIGEFWLYMVKTNSWNKILTIPLTQFICLRPLCFMKDGSMMFQKKNSSGFVAYNSITHELEQVNVIGIEANLYFNKVVTYVETLSSPNS